MMTSDSISTRPAAISTTSSNRSGDPSVPTGLAALAQRISQGISGGGESDAGLTDPFAEIFARMAVAEPVQAVEAPVEPVQTNDAEPIDEEIETESTTNEATETTVPVKDDTVDETDRVVVAVKGDQDTNESTERDSEVVPTQLDEERDHDPQQSSQQVEIVAVDVENSDPSENQVLAVEPEAAFVAAPQVAAELSTDRDTRRDLSDKSPVASNSGLPNEWKSSDTREVSTSQSPTQLEQEAGQESGDAEQNPFEGRQTERRRYTNRSNQASQDTQDSDESTHASGSTQRVTSDAKSSVESSNRSFSLGSDEPSANTGSAGSTTSSAPSTTVAVPVVASRTPATAVSSTNGGNSGVKPVSGSSPLNAVTGPESKPTADVAKSSKAAGANQLSAVQRAKLVQRVSRSFQHLGPDGGQIRMRLAPVELGSVRLDLRVQESRLRARMVTETEAASQVLREHLPQLRSSLESQGIRVESIEIETDTTGDLNSEFFQNESGQQHEQRSLPRHRRPAPQTPIDQLNQRQAVSIGALNAPSTTSEGVDLQV